MPGKKDAAVKSLAQLQTTVNALPISSGGRDQLQAEIETLRRCLDLVGLTVRRGHEVPAAT